MSQFLNQFADQMNTGGFGFQGTRNRQDLAKQQALKNQLAQQLQQAELRQRQLGNTQMARQMAQPEAGPKFGAPRQGNDGEWYQDRFDPKTGQYLGSSVMGSQTGINPTTALASNGASMPKMPPGFAGPVLPQNSPPSANGWVPPATEKKLTPAQTELAKHLPPELDPLKATTQDWVAARNAQKEGKAPKGMSEYQEKQVGRWEQEDEAARKGVEKEKAEGVEFATETLDVVKDMLNPAGIGKGMAASVGTIQGHEWMPSLRDDTVAFDNAHNFLVARLTKENLGIMKGVLSDNDIKMLKDIGTGQLKLRGGEGAYKSELLRIGEKLLMATGVTEDDIQTTMRENNMSRSAVLEALLGS